jgi:hypothetical protein
MKRAVTTLVLLSGVCATAGCGTVMNLKDEPGPTWAIDTGGPNTPAYPFGGVVRDLGLSLISFVCGVQSPVSVLYGVAFLADVPLSVIGDVVTLPIVLDRMAAKDARSAQQAAKNERAGDSPSPRPAPISPVAMPPHTPADSVPPSAP